MQGFWILLLALHITYSWAAISKSNTNHNLQYGQELTIMLPSQATKLTFQSENKSAILLWSTSSTTKKGKVMGKDKTRKFVISSVTFDDQGKYTVTLISGQPIIHSLVINKRMVSKSCVAGENLIIPLLGLAKNNAKLYFKGQGLNYTLVYQGSSVNSSHPDYMGQIRVTDTSIEVLNVSDSDAGYYQLIARQKGPVMTMLMKVVDRRDVNRNVNRKPLYALILLLGIPFCACWCCRKKICKNNSEPTTTASNINSSEAPPVSMKYTTPPGPSPVYTPGFPAVDESTVYPPPNPACSSQQTYSFYPDLSTDIRPNPGFNPVYPPASGIPPGQPPQWTGAP